MIPKVINYCWFGGKPLPKDVKKCIESWKKMCPDYIIKRWDESNFDINSSPFVKSAYDARAWAFVSDYARLKIIYENGGIYLDTDVELLKSLNHLIKYKSYFGIQQGKKLCATGLGFGAEKHSPVVLKMLQKYDNLIFSAGIKEKIACPYLNNSVIEEIGYKYSDKPVVIKGTLILPPRFLDPYSPGKESKSLRCRSTVSIHHYSASWTGKKNIIKRKIIRFIGQSRVNKIKRFLRR